MGTFLICEAASKATRNGLMTVMISCGHGVEEPNVMHLRASDGRPRSLPVQLPEADWDCVEVGHVLTRAEQ